MQKITPCLWFDTEGEEAARFYTSVFPNSRIVDVARYGSAGPRPEGTVMTVSFELDRQKFRRCRIGIRIGWVIAPPLIGRGRRRARAAGAGPMRRRFDLR